MRHGRAPAVRNMNTRPCGRTDDHMHMEFDSSLKFKDLKTVFVKSDLEVEPFVGKVWDIASGCVKNIGQAGESEMWLDYSDALRTRHLAVLVLQAEGGFQRRFASGTDGRCSADGSCSGGVLADGQGLRAAPSCHMHCGYCGLCCGCAWPGAALWQGFWSGAGGFFD